MAQHTYQAQTDQNNKRSNQSERTVSELLSELRDESVLLFRKEVALAKTEMTEKISKAGRNIGYLAGGGLVLYAGLLLVFSAISIAIALGMVAGGAGAASWWIAPLIVGIVIAGIGLGLAMKALNTLKNTSLAPEKTLETLKEDQEWIQDKLT